jgi:hypothetical protein
VVQPQLLNLKQNQVVSTFQLLWEVELLLQLLNQLMTKNL